MPASTAEIVNASVRTASGLTPIDAGRDLGIAHRAHREAPAARASRLYSDQRERRISTIAATAMPRSPMRPADERRMRDVHQAVLAAGEAFPFDGAVLDDEAERDRDHREVRARARAAPQAEQRADDRRASSAATGSVHQKFQPNLRREDRPSRRRRCA